MEIDLLAALPKPKRDLRERSTVRTSEHVRISRQYGQEYFDGDRTYGYGGYHYDGRWIPVAQDIMSHFGLRSGARVLDVGCAKGFLVKDMVDLGLDAYGLDVSAYAVRNCPVEIAGRLQIGTADQLPFADSTFDAVISINTIHNLDRQKCVNALSEIQRVSRGCSFVQVDSYRTEEQRKVFEDWVLTADFHGYPDDWQKVFLEAGYSGDWFWTIID